MAMMMAEAPPSKSERTALAKLRQGYQVVPPGATVILPGPSQYGPQREAWLKGVIAECASLMETYSDELHGDFNRRMDRQDPWACPACAQVARVVSSPFTVVNSNGHHPEQPQESY